LSQKSKILQILLKWCLVNKIAVKYICFNFDMFFENPAVGINKQTLIGLNNIYSTEYQTYILHN
jgi:hypothetical protein